MKAARTRLKKDPEVIGEGIPMVSASGRKIDISDVLYTLDYLNVNRYDPDEEEDEDEPGAFKVTAHRVIQLNYQDRYVRMRCANGCESTLHFGDDGCSKKRAYHSEADIVRQIKMGIGAKIDEESKEVKKHAKRVKDLQKLSASVKKIKVKIPEMVR